MWGQESDLRWRAKLLVLNSVGSRSPLMKVMDLFLKEKHMSTFRG